MDPSDIAEPQRWWRSPARILLIALLVAIVLILGRWAAAFFALGAQFGWGYDQRQFDDLEAAFERDPSVFAAVDAQMREYVDEHPDAVRISWSGERFCAYEPGENPVTAECEPADKSDQAAYEALPAASSVVSQAKDPGRIFFTFNQNDPPMYRIMRASEDFDVEAYADERGFRATRELTPGWTILGPISDEDLEDQQWEW